MQTDIPLKRQPGYKQTQLWWTDETKNRIKILAALSNKNVDVYLAGLIENHSKKADKLKQRK